MLLYDISSTIAPDMPVYKNRDEKRPRFKVSRDHASGSIYEGRLDIDLHSGTHLDFPLHVLPQGESSDAWNNEQFLTRCRVLDFSASAADRIGAGDLQQKEDESRHQASEPFWEAGGTVLLKTANSAKQHFDFSFVFLDTSGAEFLAQKNIVGVGIDALGIERRLGHRARSGGTSHPPDAASKGNLDFRRPAARRRGRRKLYFSFNAAKNCRGRGTAGQGLFT